MSQLSLGLNESLFRRSKREIWKNEEAEDIHPGKLGRENAHYGILCVYISFGPIYWGQKLGFCDFKNRNFNKWGFYEPKTWSSDVRIQCEEYKSECVRFAQSYDTIKSFCVGDQIELWRDFGFSGWVKARICSFKGDYYACDYLVREQYSKNVVGLSDLRPVNTYAPLSTDSFFLTNFELPESIHLFCENNPNQHEDGAGTFYSVLLTGIMIYGH